MRRTWLNGLNLANPSQRVYIANRLHGRESMTTRALSLMTLITAMAGVLAAPVAWAAPSAAAVATLDTTAGPFTSDSETGSSDASATVVDIRTVFVASGGGNVLQGDEAASARAAAGVGVLRVAASATQGLQGGLNFTSFNTGASANATARFSIDDLVVSALPGGAPSPAFTSLSLRFAVSGLLPDVAADGEVFDTARKLLAPADIFASATSELTMSIGVAETGGSTLGTHQSLARLLALTTQAVGVQPQAPVLTGGFAGRLFALQNNDVFVVETGPITVPVDAPLTLNVELRGLARTSANFPQGGGIFESSAQLFFDHTVTFATDGVAALADGFTLNSVQAGIVDNQWAPVPVPPAACLMLSAVAGLLWCAKRATRS